MLKRKFTHGITIYVAPDMYQDISRISDDMEIGMSELIRNIIEHYIQSTGGQTK